MVLEAGDPAPTIRARNQAGDVVEPSLDTATVVYFYPRDDTPGCTTEAGQFQAELETYRDAGVEVYGVSTDDVDSHASFASDTGVTFDLLADPAGRVADAFAVPTSNGRADRTTFVIAGGVILTVYRSVRPDGHARRVLGDMLDDGIVTLGE